MAQREVEKWITVKGAHIPIFKGESVEQALLRQFKKTGDSGITSQVEYGKRYAVPELKSRDDAYNYYKDKYTVCSTVYRNRTAQKLGITGTVQEKIEGISKALADKWSKEHNHDTDEAKKQEQITRNQEEAKQAASQTVKSPSTSEHKLDDPLKGVLGERQEVKDTVGRIKELQSTVTITNSWGQPRERSMSLTNPHYHDNPQPKGQNYHNNCALCTAATIMQAKGYDVEAGLQGNRHRDIDDILKPDFTNPDNFIFPSSKSSFDYSRRNFRNRLESELKTKYPDKKWWEIDELVDKEMKKYTMPKGAEKATKAIIDKIKSWGSGAYGELCVSWAERQSSHSLFVYNDNGNAVIFDSQTGRIYPEDQIIPKLMQRTKANNTQLVRFDNATFKEGSIDAEAKVMFKPRNKK